MTGSLQVKRGIYYMTVSFKDEKGVCRQKSKSTGIPEKRGSKRKAQQMLDKAMSTTDAAKDCPPRPCANTSPTSVKVWPMQSSWI